MINWIKKNIVLYTLLSVIITITLTTLVLKIYVDYRIKQEVTEIKYQLDNIETSTNAILKIIQEVKK